MVRPARRAAVLAWLKISSFTETSSPMSARRAAGSTAEIRAPRWDALALPADSCGGSGSGLLARRPRRGARDAAGLSRQAPGSRPSRRGCCPTLVAGAEPYGFLEDHLDEAGRLARARLAPTGLPATGTRRARRDQPGDDAQDLGLAGARCLRVASPTRPRRRRRVGVLGVGGGR